MGVGMAGGDHKTVDAAQRAISSPLLDEVSMAGATAVLINVTGNSDLTLYEINEACSLIQEEAHEDVNLIWGWVTDESMQDQVRVTVVATGFQEGLQAARPSAERQVAVKVANGGSRGQARGPLNRELASGFDLRHDDYDIPTFFKHAD